MAIETSNLFRTPDVRSKGNLPGKGSLMPTQGLSRLAIAFVLAISLAGCSNPATHSAYVTLPTTNRVLAYRVRNSTGELTTAFGGSFVTGQSPLSVAVHPTGRFVYVANSGENTISLFSVDSSSGSLNEIRPRTTSAARPTALAMDPGGNFLYVINQGVNAVSSFAVDSGKGTLTAVAGPLVSTGFNPAALAVTPSGKFLYVSNSNSDSVSAYSLSSGALTAVPGSPVAIGRGPMAIAVDPGEHFVYVTNTADSTISVLAIDPTTGALTNILGSPFNIVQINNTGAATGAVSIAITPAGTLLYIANQISGNVTFYSLGPSGVPIEMTNSPFTSGLGTNFVVADTVGNFLFIGDQSRKQISVYNIDTTLGGLTLTSLVPTGVGATQMVLTK